jgi:hypothetical protein
MPAIPSTANPPSKMAGAGGANVGFAGGPMGAGAPSAGGGALTAFGFREAKSGTLIGTFYDLKQDKQRKPTDMDAGKYAHLVQDFVKNGWSTAKFGDYFTAPNKLYAKEIFVPSTLATEGPKAFGVEKDVQPKLWLVHYIGKVSPPESGTFNFVGGGDDVLYVRFNGKTVLDACYWNRGTSVLAKGEAFYDYHWPHTAPPFVKGEPISVTAGQSYPIEVLIGEQPGGLLHFCLLLEQSGKKYTLDEYKNPILPVFRLENSEPKPGPKGAYPPFAPGGPVWSGDAAKSSIFKTQLPGGQ